MLQLIANDSTIPHSLFWMFKHLGHLASDPLQTQPSTVWHHSRLCVLKETKALPGLSLFYKGFQR